MCILLLVSVHLKEQTSSGLYRLVLASKDFLQSVPWTNEIISGIRVVLCWIQVMKLLLGLSLVCSWWACYQGLRLARILCGYWVNSKHLAW